MESIYHGNFIERNEFGKSYLRWYIRHYLDSRQIQNIKSDLIILWNIWLILKQLLDFF